MLLNLFVLFRFVECFGGFGRHVVFVVLRHNLIGVEHTVRVHAALGYAAAAFFEKVRKNSFVDDGNAVRCVGNSEANGQAVGVAFKRSFANQSANAKCFVYGNFFGGDLRWAEEENQVLSNAPSTRNVARPIAARAAQMKMIRL